jgi:hypothetical protein
MARKLLHPFKFGKLPAVKDDRVPLFRSMLRATVQVPAKYNFDLVHPGCRPHMYLNDTYGDCVMAARAEHQIRLNLLRLGKVTTIKDSEVKREYFKETGGEDSGLDVNASLTAWIKGWKAGGKKVDIAGFSSVNMKSIDEIRQTIYLCGGMPIGVALPDDAMADFEHGRTWSNTKLPPNPDSGHCIYLLAYDQLSVTCITWAGYQRIMIPWLRKYADEGFAVHDDLKQKSVRKHMYVDRLLEHMDVLRKAA